MTIADHIREDSTFNVVKNLLKKVMMIHLLQK